MINSEDFSKIQFVSPTPDSFDGPKLNIMDDEYMFGALERSVQKKHVAPHNRILVLVNLSQKRSYQIAFNGTTLLLDSEYGADGKIANPTLAKVYDVGSDYTDLKEGDVIVTHHNVFRSVITTEANGNKALLGDTGIKIDGLSLFSIHYAQIQFKVNENGEALPLSGNVIVERIKKPVNTTLIVPDTVDEKYPNRFKVISVGQDCDGVSAGDTIITYDKSDYELSYTFNQKRMSTIRVKYQDVLAIDNYEI